MKKERTKKHIELQIAKHNHEIEKLTIELNYYEEPPVKPIGFITQ